MLTNTDIIVIFIVLLVMLGLGIIIYLRPAKHAGKRTAASARKPETHLDAVMAASFSKRQLMNRGEYRVFRLIEQDISRARQGFRIFAQAALGEILESPAANAFKAINSKRVDLLVVDKAGWPMLAIEYQGEGHYQGNAAARDAVKKEALRKAGISCVEIIPDDSDEQIRFRVREALGWQASVSIEHRVEPSSGTVAGATS